MNKLVENCSAILLVGEASFSFSASLSKYLSNHGNTIQMICSSYESEEDVKGKLKGGQNVQVLKQHGAKVLYELDVTKLHESALLADRRFDAIIFNFPHIGKKGSIKKNRHLLKEFFVSCSHMTSDTGHVIVSLCNGQGGTPMDTPHREWNNSWQIVAMATYGGFILTSAIPFALDASGDYTSTGYRGQNKGFHTEGAITHIFQKSLPVAMPPFPQDKVKPTQFIDDDNITFTADIQGIGIHTIHIEDELKHFINRKLLHEENHPLHAMSSQLISDIKSRIPELQEIPHNSLPLVLQQTHQKCHTTYAINLVNKDGDIERDVGVRGANPARGPHKSGQTLQQAHHKCHTTYGIDLVHTGGDMQRDVGVSGANPARGLHKSGQTLQQTHHKCHTMYGIDLVKTGGDMERDDGGRDVGVSGANPARGLHNVHGDSMRNAEVLSNVEVSGAHHLTKEIQGLQSDDIMPDDAGERTYSLVSNILQYLPMILDQHPLHPVALSSQFFRRCTISRNTLPIMHQMLIVVPQPNALWDDYLNLELGIMDFELDGEGTMPIIGRAACQTLDTGMRDDGNICHSSYCSLPPTLKVTDAVDGNRLKKEIADPMESCEKVTYKSIHAKFIGFSLDQLVMQKYSISDIRVLWSEDPCQWTSLQQQVEAAEQHADQLTNVKFKEPVKELQALQPVSKFPVMYTHDLSFSVTPESRFDKLKFFYLLRKVTGLVLEEVMLIDTYADENTEWSSLCYRLVYTGH